MCCVRLDNDSTFLPNAKVLYMGDASESGMVCEAEELERFGIKRDDLKHNKCPDIILLDADHTSLCIVEAFNSKNPFTEERRADIQKEILYNCALEKRWVTAFWDRKAFSKQSATLAWGTEAWCAADPEHIILFK